MTTIEIARIHGRTGARLSAALLALLGASFSGMAAADVPATIHETGRLFQLGQASASTPLQGSRQLTFNLYPSQNAAAATAVWSEIHLVDVADGYFSVELGTAVPLSALLRSSPELWLGIQVDTDEELQPRFRLSAVPYALLAADVQGTINPTAIRINGTTVINAAGQWVGSSGGAAGPAGPAGPSGPAGPTGSAGPVGASGAPGPTGPMGPTGLTGAAGPAGAVGAAGPQGPVGPAGTPGPSGPAGPAGATGLVFRNAWLVSTLYARNDAVFYNGSSYLSLAAANIGQQPDTTPAAWTLLAQKGAAGPQGTAGAAGPQGPAGVAGSAGVAGPIGPTGAAGPKGATGATGPQGPVGATGANGAAGPQGPIGLTGSAGAVGPAGANGATGPIGPQGPAGATGATGTQGLTFRNTWATATAYALGDAVAFNGASYISLLNANVGQQPDVSLAAWAVLAQKGAAGAAGATGATGPAGPVGAAGSPGIAGVAGPIGPAGATGPTGATGPMGAQGPIGPAGPAGAQGLTFRNTWATATSYALGDAVAFNGASYVSLLNTNIGQQPDVSLAAWALLAQKGAAGAAGATGATGLAGPVGATGPAGPIGPAGAAGSPGSAGPQGPVGVAGPTGATGPAGVAGPQGIPGVAGVPGPQGTQGIPGAAFALPFTASQANAGALLGIANTGDGDALDVAVAGNGAGIFVVSSGSAGKAARFTNTTSTNMGNVLEVETNAQGSPATDAQGGAYFLVNNQGGLIAAVKGEVNTIFGNFGAAGVYGKTSGTGGAGGAFYASNPNGAGVAVQAVSNGSGNAIVATTSGTGGAGYFANSNPANTSDVLHVATASSGNTSASNPGQGGAYFFVNNSNSVAAAVRGEVNTIFANFGAAAVYGKTSGTGGVGGLFTSENTNGNGTALLAYNRGSGTTFVADHEGTSGDIAKFASFGLSVARIDKTGKGFFNGGTQVGGADLAEFVPTTGAAPQIGDVVEIDPDQPDRFRLSSGANNGRVAGVISTAPGVTLNAGSGAVEAVTGAALALAGRVPVKVTCEGGPIHIGDLLVASSTAGHAMRAPAQPALGTVIGKALRNFDQQQGSIEMLVMLR